MLSGETVVATGATNARRGAVILDIGSAGHLFRRRDQHAICHVQSDITLKCGVAKKITLQPAAGYVCCFNCRSPSRQR